MKDEKFFGEGIESIEGKEWNWNFKSTKGYPVSKHLLSWVVGQDFALKECFLCLDEWRYKLKYLQKKKWYKPWLKIKEEKPTAKQVLTPGPYLLLLGDPGTGKSLMGRAMAEKLTQVYKKDKIKMFDILSWPNKVLPSTPHISIHETGKGKEIAKKLGIKARKKNRFMKWGFRILQSLMIGFGTFILGITFYNIISGWYGYSGWVYLLEHPGSNFLGYFIDSLMANVMMIYLGMGILSMGAMLFIFKHIIGTMGGNRKGIGGAESTNAPKLLIDNSAKAAPFIDATGHTSAQLFGSVAWDPYQTGGLGTPSHQRVTAGDVHRASLGILYIDEIKNLKSDEAITLLTVLEDGQLCITMRDRWHGGGTSAMAVATEPVPCMTFLVAAGNFDSIGQIHPALMDRIVGYGKVVRMSNDMSNTLKNRRKYVQFIAQESKRFHLPPFTKEACIEIVREGRRKSNKRYRLTTKFRPLISIIKTAGTLAKNDKNKVVKDKHVLEAINVHCKTIQKQLLEHEIEERGMFMEIAPEGSKLGTIYGLAVVTESYSKEHTGTVLRVKASMEKIKKKHSGSFVVTGIAKESKWIEDSTKKVKSVILKKYGVDISQDYNTHIDFSQAYGVDGPSAGVTMTILLCSLLEGKHIRQDIAVTGEINITSTDEIEITAVGGIHEKIKAAEGWKFNKVIIPDKNFKLSINPSEYKIEILGGNTLTDYLKEVLINKENL